MEFIPYDKASDASNEFSLTNLAHSVLMSIYLEKNPGAEEADINKMRYEIETLISEINQWFEKTMLPINATIKLAEKQFISLDYLDGKLINEIMQADNIDSMMNENSEIRKYIDTAIDELKKKPLIKPYDALYQQSITAYENDLFDLAVLGFFAIIDGLLSDITMDRASVKIKQRTEKAVNSDSIHVSVDIVDINKAIQKASLLRVSELLSESKSFSGEEPETLNRHWSMHGRTRTKKTKVDCEKLILFIYGLISIAGTTSGELT